LIRLSRQRVFARNVARRTDQRQEQLKRQIRQRNIDSRARDALLADIYVQVADDESPVLFSDRTPVQGSRA